MIFFFEWVNQLLTRFTTIELSSQGNQTMEAYRVDSDVACNDSVLQFVAHNCVLICVSIKYLEKKIFRRLYFIYMDIFKIILLLSRLALVCLYQVQVVLKANQCCYRVHLTMLMTRSLKLLVHLFSLSDQIRLSRHLPWPTGSYFLSRR